MFIKTNEVISEQRTMNQMRKLIRLKCTYRLVGCGFPFFIEKYHNLISLCDFFIDDDFQSESYYKNRMSIKTISDIRKSLSDCFIICFSYNRFHLIQVLRGMGFPDDRIILMILDEFIDKQYLQPSDIIQSDKLQLRSNAADQLNIRNGAVLSGANKIDLISNSKIVAEFLFMENAYIRSENDNLTNISSLYIFSSNIDIARRGSLNVEGVVMESDCSIMIYDGSLNMKHVYMGKGCRVMVYNHIFIGNGCLISWGVSILDGDGHSLEYNQRSNKPQPIIIHDHVWIGNGATILKGVEIGEGSVIGSNTVVTHSVPRNSLVVGNPGRVVASNVIWENNYHY